MNKKPNLKLVLFTRLVLSPLVIFMTVVLAWLILDNLFLSQMEANRTQAESLEKRMQTLQRQVVELGRQLKVYETYQSEYRQLDQAWLKPVDRALWADSLNQISQNWLASGLSLSFGSESKLQARDVNQLLVGRPIFNQTHIGFNIRFQSDSDFFKFVDYLRQDLNPNLWLERCDIQRQQAGFQSQATLNPNQGNIRVECQLVHFYSQPRMFDAKEFSK